MTTQNGDLRGKTTAFDNGIFKVKGKKKRQDSVTPSFSSLRAMLSLRGWSFGHGFTSNCHV